MGNYLFETETLVQEVVRDAANDQSAHDFGKSIISDLYKHARVHVYDFAENSYPGHEPKERGYWRDVGNIDVYHQANMDLVGVDPIFNLYNDLAHLHQTVPILRPVRLQRRGERAGGVRHRQPGLRRVHHLRGHVHRASSTRVRVNSFTEVSEASSSRTSPSAGAPHPRAIVDKSVEIPAGVTIGYDGRRTADASTHSGGRGGHPKGMKLVS
jgi:glucose-1-phosphate adenylyltransferase